MDGVALQRARESLDLVHLMSDVLGTGLDRQTLAILVALCEHGVNPEALAAVVKELRREAAAYAQKQS
jgi:mitotic-spindle organizing protein 1